MSKAILSILCISATAVVIGCGTHASRAQPEDLPAMTGAFYALSVRSIDDAIAWYTNAPGFQD